jgi:type IV secretion system protein VirD4
MNKSEAERSGVLSTAISFLALYRDPVIARVTRNFDWRITDLVKGDQPVTLYIVVPPSDIGRTKPLIRLILNQIGRRLMEELDTKSKRHRVLLMLDEFPALGRLDFFETALAFMAGYGIKAFLIAQSLNQIEKAYGANNAILDNCHVRVSFATNDERTAKRVSDALGMATELRAMKNYAGNRLSPWLGHLMVSRSETARPLLTSGEIMNLPQTDEIVMMSGLQPIRAKKAQYYRDKRLMGRVLLPPVLVPRLPNEGNSAARDDWSHMPVIAAPPMPDEKTEVKPVPTPAPAETKPCDPGNAEVETTAADGVEDRHHAPNDGYEFKREPELNPSEHVGESFQKVPREFGFGVEFGNEDHAERNRKTQKRMKDVAKQAALDPADDMGMG